MELWQTLIVLEVVIVTIFTILFFYAGRYVKAILLVVLGYFSIPTPDEALWMPSLSEALHIPLLVLAIFIYTTAWILIYLLITR